MWTGVGTWTNWSTFEPDPGHSPDAGTGKSEIESRSNGHLTQSRIQVTRCTAERYCLLHVVAKSQKVSAVRSSFLYDVRLRSYGFVYSADADADGWRGRGHGRGLCVLGELCVDMWRLVHHWYFFAVWLFLTTATLLVQSW